MTPVVCWRRDDILLLLMGDNIINSIFPRFHSNFHQRWSISFNIICLTVPKIFLWMQHISIGFKYMISYNACAGVALNLGGDNIPRIIFISVMVKQIDINRSLNKYSNRGDTHRGAPLSDLGGIFDLSWKQRLYGLVFCAIIAVVLAGLVMILNYLRPTCVYFFIFTPHL